MYQTIRCNKPAYNCIVLASCACTFTVYIVCADNNPAELCPELDADFPQDVGTDTIDRT